MQYCNLLLLFLIYLITACQNNSNPAKEEAYAEPSRTPVIFDTDANNELDDQHALAYLLFNQGVFDILGITVNRTLSGGGIKKHVEEAARVVKLCNVDTPIHTGADADFNTIKNNLNKPDFDGATAVNFIIDKAREAREGKLLLLPVGKLTNIALALKKAPDIVPKVRVLWMGSNYPEPGEYNQDNDTASLNYILETDVEFEIATVRYGKDSGTDAVRVTPAEVETNVKGKGPKIADPVTGRHGNTFSNFGDYAYDLFQHIDLYGDPPARALFDMAAVAIAKNPDWATATTIPAPKLVNNTWIDQPDNPRKIVLWEFLPKPGKSDLNRLIGRFGRFQRKNLYAFIIGGT